METSCLICVFALMYLTGTTMTQKTITHAWEDEERTILRIDYAPGWTLQDYGAVGWEILTEMQQVSHGVYTINNFGPNFELPPGFFRVLYRMQSVMPDNLQLAIVVADDNMRDILFRLFKRIVPWMAQRTRLATNLDEARALICEHKARNEVEDSS